MDQLGEKLRSFREKEGYSKSEIARQLGISSQLYGQYEKGDKTPGIGFVGKWKKAFNFDITETKVSHETVSTGNKAEASGEDLSTLIKSNASLVETLAKCQEDQRELIAMLKANSVPGAHEQSMAAINQTLVDTLLRIGHKVGMWPSVEAGRKELGKTVAANMEKQKAAHSEIV